MIVAIDWIALTARPTSNGIARETPMPSQANDQRPPQFAPVGAKEAHQAAEIRHLTSLYKVKYWCSEQVTGPVSGRLTYSSAAAALALATIPFLQGLISAWPVGARISKFVTPWKGVIVPLLLARLMTMWYRPAGRSW